MFSILSLAIDSLVINTQKPTISWKLSSFFLLWKTCNCSCPKFRWVAVFYSKTITKIVQIFSGSKDMIRRTILVVTKQCLELMDSTALELLLFLKSGEWVQKKNILIVPVHGALSYKKSCDTLNKFLFISRNFVHVQLENTEMFWGCWKSWSHSTEGDGKKSAKLCKKNIWHVVLKQKHRAAVNRSRNFVRFLSKKILGIVPHLDFVESKKNKVKSSQDSVSVEI